jgi:hypothetical protein
LHCSLNVSQFSIILPYPNKSPVKPTLIVLACFFTLGVYANSSKDTVPSPIIKPGNLPQAYQPVFRLTAKEIESLHFTSIMEVINGAFPFVFADPPVAKDYNFIFDGNILVNPNAINISQIATIEYFPVAFDLAGGSLSAKGTFVITSKNAASPGYGLIVRSQGGVIKPDSTSFGLNPGGRFKATGSDEHFMHHEIAYGFSKNKFTAGASASYTGTAVPRYNITAPSGREDYFDEFKRTRFSANVAYKLTSKIKLSANAFWNKQNSSHNRDVSLINFPNVGQVNAERKPRYWSAHAAMQFQPAANITNVLQLEYADVKDDSASNTYARSTNPAFNRTTISNNTIKDRSFAITNSLSATFKKNADLSFGAELLIRYYEQKLKTDFVTVTRQDDGFILSAAAASIKSDARSIAFMPRLSVQMLRQFFATAGLTYDDWENSAFPYVPVSNGPSLEKIFPYAGVRWNMPYPAGVVSSASVHSTYGKSWQSPVKQDLLDIYSNGNIYGFFFSDEQKEASVNWISGLDIGFAKNRFKFSFNCVKGSFFPLLYGMTPAPFGSVIFYSEVKRSGLSAGFDAAIVDKQKVSVKFKTILFYDAYELKDTANQQLIKVNNPMLNEKGQWRGTVQLMTGVGRFSLQAIALLRFKETKTVFVPFQGYRTDEFSNHGLNFVLLSYRIPLKPALLKQLEITAQGRNLVALKQTPSALYYGSKYYGLGLRLGM